MLTILFLEDDPDQSETISKDLRRAFPALDLCVCYTESDVLVKLQELPMDGLAFAVLDAMVPWCFPVEDMPVPPVNVQKDGVRFAGKRCLQALRDKFGKEVPVWIYSVLSSDGHGVLPEENTFVLEKQPENGELVAAIRHVLNADLPPTTQGFE